MAARQAHNLEVVGSNPTPATNLQSRERKMFYLYILENEKGRLYIGVSQNVEKRLEYHNKSRGSDWTQGKGNWKSIHIEEYLDKSEALKRETYLKSLKAGQRIKKMLSID